MPEVNIYLIKTLTFVNTSQHFSTPFISSFNRLSVGKPLGVGLGVGLESLRFFIYISFLLYCNRIVALKQNFPIYKD